MKFKTVFAAIALVMLLNLFGGVLGFGASAKAEAATDPQYDENAIALSQDLIAKATPAVTISERDLTATVNTRMLVAQVGEENARIVTTHINEYNALTAEQRINGETYSNAAAETSATGSFQAASSCSVSAKLTWYWWGASVKLNHCAVQAITLNDLGAVVALSNWLISKGFISGILAGLFMTYAGIYKPFLKAADDKCGKGATLNVSYFTLPFGWVTNNC